MESAIMTSWHRPTGAAIVGLGLIFVALPVMAQQGPPPARVSTAEVTLQLLSPEIQVPGTVISQNDSRISSEISGRIVWVAEVGTAVKQGDVLARIEETNFATALTQAEANVKSLEADLLYRTQDVKRLEELAATGNTPVRRLEEAVSQRVMVEQSVIQGKAALKRAQKDVERTQVRAPFPGRIVERLSQMGEFASPGALLVRLVDTQHLEVRAQAPISSAPHLKEGMKVSISGQNRQIQAPLRAVIPVGDEISRMMEIRLEVDPGIWVIGSAVRVSLPSAASRQVIAVPRDALILRANTTYVYRINAENKAERVVVSTGIASGSLIEILGSVVAGDRVVVRGGERLREGQEVIEGEAS